MNDIKNILKINHNAGFFSCSTIRLRLIINYYNQHKILPDVDSSEQWKFYKDQNEDVTKKFFKENNIIFKSENVEFIDSQYEDQFSDYSLLNFKLIDNFVKKYFSLSQEVYELKDQLIKNYGIDTRNIMSIYYRGNDKSMETVLPNYNDYLEVIEEKLNIYPNLKILVQSDEKEFYDFIKYNVKDIIYFDEIPKWDKGLFNDALKIPNGHKTYNAQLFLAIISLISESHSVIINSGNVGMWITLFRGNVKNVSQFINNKELIYGIKNDNFNKTDKKWIHN